MEKNKKKVVVAISGGVDSAVAAMILLEQGFEVIGVFMRLGQFGARSEAAARAVCRHLGIKFYPVNISQKFNAEVVDYFIESYAKGITPNPCVKCNRVIKFGELLRVMRDLGADHLATGHYGRIKKSELRSENYNEEKRLFENNFVYELHKAKDLNKDQTYFIYNLTQNELQHLLFPLGSMTKDEVRAKARESGVPFIESESQDICFMNDEKGIIEHNELLMKHIDLKPGNIVWLKKDGGGRTEVVVGEHRGLPLYTIGQRRGIEIGGIGPFYAARMDYSKNTLHVVDSPDDELLFSSSFELKDLSWVPGKCPALPLECEIVIRYRHPSVPCRIEGAEKGRVKVILKKPQRAIMPGQSAVFYETDDVLGGGIVI